MIVYQDSREQKPLDFTFYGFDQEIIYLPTGDYFFEDYPDLVIERKRNTAEISMNLNQKWKQFEAELIRMTEFKHPYLVCEFPLEYLDIFPEKSGIPQNKLKNIRLPSWVLKQQFFSACSKYDIKPLFFNNKEEMEHGIIEILKAL